MADSRSSFEGCQSWRESAGVFLSHWHSVTRSFRSLRHEWGHVGKVIVGFRGTVMTIDDPGISGAVSEVTSGQTEAGQKIGCDVYVYWLWGSCSDRMGPKTS
jgi:hypothetical protein